LSSVLHAQKISAEEKVCRKTARKKLEDQSEVERAGAFVRLEFSTISLRGADEPANDLYNLEGTGIEDKYCQKISASLNYFSNAATNIPSAMPLMGPLYKDIEKFTELYQKWNDVAGQGPGGSHFAEGNPPQIMDQRQKIHGQGAQTPGGHTGQRGYQIDESRISTR